MIELLDEVDSLSPEEKDDLIHDEADTDDTVLPQRYDITSYGIDFDVGGLVRRLEERDIVIPDWQRQYVWTFKQASSFIESLLLGLPIPGIFLGRYPSGQLYVIDGQQRLRTLQFFYSGKFSISHPSPRSRPFKLEGVHERFEGFSFLELADPVRRDLNNSLIHATVVRQEAPADDDTSMYQIFKRLNFGGNKVTPQEIRCAVYQGSLIDRIKLLNDNPSWRKIIGRPSLRLKDQEMILRFFAMWKRGDNYTKPMVEFLNLFTLAHENPDDKWLTEMSSIFEVTVEAFAQAIDRPFRLRGGRVVNVAVFDSMAIGLAKRIRCSGVSNLSNVAAVHEALIIDEEYLQAATGGTSDENSVRERLRIATEAFIDA